MLTEVYGADSVKSRLSLICRFKNGREFMKDERIGQPMTRRTDEIVEQVWTFVCTDRRFSIRIMTKEVNVDRIPGEDLNLGFVLRC
jgi:hypothetical protein